MQDLARRSQCQFLIFAISLIALPMGNQAALGQTSDPDPDEPFVSTGPSECESSYGSSDPSMGFENPAAGGRDTSASATPPCGAPECPEALWPGACDIQYWPHGQVYYRFDPSMPAATQTNVRKAMDDWEVLTKSTVRFISTTMPGSAEFPVVTLKIGNWGVGYDGCGAAGPNCVGGLSEGDVYHELGHDIGLYHHWLRSDQYRYFRENRTMCTEPHCFDPPDTNLVDFGPFDYRSTMMYSPTHPDFTRWDFSPIVPGTACGTFTGIPVPGCPGGTGSGCSCSSCGLAQPYGLPTKGDASAVIELYGSVEQGWKKFLPMAKDVGTDRPYSNLLAPGVMAKGDPAISSWSGELLDAFILGTDKHIYGKFKAFSGGKFAAWSDWGDHGGNFAFGPGAVSWASGRNDIFAVSTDGNVMMRSYSNGWLPWVSIGAPPVPAASAPAVSSWGVGRLDVFVRGTNNHLYWRRCDASNGDCTPNSGNWSAWTTVGTGTFFGNPAAVSRAPNKIDVFVHAMNHRVWSLFYNNNGWSDFFPLGTGSVETLSGTTQSDGTCPNCSSPAAGSRGENNIDLYIRSTDDLIWVSTWSGSWTAFQVLGGVLSSSPATVTKFRDTNRTDIVALMPDTGSDSEPSLWWKSKVFLFPTGVPVPFWPTLLLGLSLLRLGKRKLK